MKGCLVLNVFLQIVASLSGNLFATWFGPVSIVAPVFFAAQLLANLVVYWIVLGLEAFSHEMQSESSCEPVGIDSLLPHTSHQVHGTCLKTTHC